MIFVIFGTERYLFDRFVKAVDRLVEEGILKEDVFMQLGSCVYEPRRVKFESFLSFGDMCENIQKASMVLAHAGAGTTLLSLQLGKKLILFPRLARHKEHVDNHQVPFATNNERSGQNFGLI